MDLLQRPIVRVFLSPFDLVSSPAHLEDAQVLSEPVGVAP